MNEAIFYFFYNFANQNVFIDKVIIFLGETFLPILIILAGLFLLFHHEVFKADNPGQILRQKYKEIFLVFLSGAVAWTLAHAVKYFIHIPRPFESLEGVAALFGKTGSSFPSGHAAFSMALAISIFYCHKKAGYVFMVLALVMSFARIAAGVHYPWDILGGFILGGAVAMVFQKLYSKFA